MAAPNSKPFSQLVSDMATAIQGSVASLVDLSIGSILRALVEACAGVVLWLQGLILTLLATTRAATSNQGDLDTWMADFGITRLPAIAATGNVTFSRFTTASQAVISPGVTVQTQDGTQQYTVIAQPTNPAWNVGLSAYVIAAGVASVTGIPVLANTAGAAGNAAPGAVNTLASAVPYVDAVTNPLQFTTGANAESDPALRTRFIGWINSLSKATVAAIGNAITSAELGAVYTITENKHYDGSTDIGYFTVVVDDGSGSPPTAYLNAVASAIDAVRAVTTRFGVYGPVTVTVTVSLTVALAAGYDPVATRTLVTNALKTYIDSLALGQTLTYTRLAQVAYDASAGVVNVTSVLLNGATADVSVTPQQVLKWSSVVVS